MMEKKCVVYDIKRRELNKMFGFGSHEYFLSRAMLGTPLEEKVKPVKFELIYVDGSGTFEKNEHMEPIRVGYLCLEQYSLGTQGAMTFFLLSKCLGNRKMR